MTVDPWLEKASRSLRSAIIILEDGDHDAACSRAYYAMFNAARAALIGVGHSKLGMGKTHKGMIASFSEHVVQAGHLPAEFGRALSIESNRRLVADYQGDGVSGQDAELAIANATKFLAAVEAMLNT